MCTTTTMRRYSRGVLNRESRGCIPELSGAHALSRYSPPLETVLTNTTTPIGVMPVRGYAPLFPTVSSLICRSCRSGLLVIAATGMGGHLGWAVSRQMGGQPRPSPTTRKQWGRSVARHASPTATDGPGRTVPRSTAMKEQRHAAGMARGGLWDTQVDTQRRAVVAQAPTCLFFER